MERPPIEIVDDDARYRRGGSGCDVCHRTEQPHREPPPVVGEDDEQYRLDQRQDDARPDRLDHA